MTFDATFNESNQTIYADFGEVSVLGGVQVAGVKIGYIKLLASAWEGKTSPYSQVVTLAGLTANSKVDLQPSVEQLEIFHQKDVAFTTENESGILTVYAVGDKPSLDYIIQATIMEVE